MSPAQDPPGRLSAPVLIATWFGLGLLRPGPGTWGTLGALALGLVWQLIGPPAALPWGFLGASVLCTALGLWSCAPASRHFGRKDPGAVVIDEIAGFYLGMSVIGPGHAALWYSALIVFALFRLFDILKPWPISRLERLPGSWGVMSDDLAAGLVAGLLTLVLPL